jgi:hypothetical protein
LEILRNVAVLADVVLSEVISSIYFANFLVFFARNLTVGVTPRKVTTKIIVKQSPNRTFFHLALPWFVSTT